MLYDLAIGDAFGRAFEFNTSEFVKKFNTGDRYIVRDLEEPENLFGTYTDDTQMSIAIAEHILNKEPSSPKRISEYFVDTYFRDVHQGYSKRMRAAFNSCLDGKFIRKDYGKTFFNACHTDQIVSSNGTMMRSVPIGILKSEGDVVRYAQIQSAVTHCSPDASLCSQLIAIISHYYYYRKHGGDLSISCLVEYLDAYGFTDILNMCMNAFTDNTDTIIPCDAKITTGAVLKVLFASKTTTEILVKSVALGGDVDSVACVASGLGSLKDDIKVDFSKHIITGLENEKYGLDYLCNLDRRIEEMFPRDND